MCWSWVQLWLLWNHSHGHRHQLAQGEPSRADEEEAAYQKVYDAEQTRLHKAEKELEDAIQDIEETKALRDSNHRKFTFVPSLNLIDEKFTFFTEIGQYILVYKCKEVIQDGK